MTLIQWTPQRREMLRKCLNTTSRYWGILPREDRVSRGAAMMEGQGLVPESFFQDVPGVVLPVIFEDFDWYDPDDRQRVSHKHGDEDEDHPGFTNTNVTTTDRAYFMFHEVGYLLGVPWERVALLYSSRGVTQQLSALGLPMGAMRPSRLRLMVTATTGPSDEMTWKALYRLRMAHLTEVGK